MRTSYLLIAILAVSLAACRQQPPEPIFDDGTSRYWKAAQAPFYHGVASGDPLPDAVIIWTRVTPEAAGPLEGTWTVAADEAMQEVVNSGDFTTDADRDYTVKIDVRGLQPATHYYYRFSALGRQSPVGRTKTSPENDPSEVRLAVVSCSNFEAGYFNALGRIADLEELDAVVHLGDYIYEYAVGGYGDTTLGRYHLPDKELVALQDYRTRYSQYRLDEDFQRVHQRHAFITIWDDHEISNNAYQSGAQNHQPDQEGDYNIRKSAASQAYYEWLPVRDDTATHHLYRTFHFGALADLIMLDERLAGRSAPVDSANQEGFRSTERSMLGKEQLQWFKDQLQHSTARWKIIGNQVIFSPLDITALGWNAVINMDAWDGYPAEQAEITQFLKSQSIKNVIFVTGDTHRSWAFEVPESIAAYQQDTAATVAVEFGATSISSSNADEGLPRDSVLEIERITMDPATNPHLKYNNQRDHGYLLLTLGADAASAAFHMVSTVRSSSTAESVDRRVIVRPGSHHLILE